jgi:hypothetical protein
MHLIWPAYRDDSVRVSEQESKIVITHWLEQRGFSYSVETPTREMYVQKGTAPRSARTDLTIYGTRNRADRIFNCELKAGYPNVEAFRKDFEKLLREGVPGIWFHTLTNVGSGRLFALATTLSEAANQVWMRFSGSRCALHIAFCVLDPPQLVQFDLDDADWRNELRLRFDSAWSDPSRPAWIEDAGTAQTRTGEASEWSKRLVYMPTVEPHSFIHLNLQGSSYAIRSFAIC